MSDRFIDLTGRSRVDLLVIAERACSALASIANNLTSGEGHVEQTEEEFGLAVSEVVEMAHDNMIAKARNTLDSIIKDFPQERGAKNER